MISRLDLYAAGEPFGECATEKRIDGKYICGLGGGGGGGGTSTTVQNIPNELKPLASKYSSDAINLSNTAYTPYTGQRFADLNSTQNAGIDAITNRATNGSATMNNAEQSLNQQIDGTSNPYLDAMVQKAQQSVLGSGQQAAVRSGSFGNSGIAEATARQLGDVATTMYGGAYDGDRARQLQAIGMAPTFGNQAYTDANQLLNAGQIQQDQEQQKADFGYQQFQDQQNDPYKKLAAMSGVFQSAPGQSSTTTQTGGGK